MRLSKDKQIENCLVAIDMVKSLPKRAFTPGLFAWTSTQRQQHCGSAACLGGWIAQHPHFQKLGVYPDTEDNGAPRTRRNDDPSLVAEELFGNPSMFTPVDYFPSESYERPGDDEKQVVLNRLRIALNALV